VANAGNGLVSESIRGTVRALFFHRVYTEEVGVDGHDPKLVVELEKHRDEYIKNYKDGNASNHETFRLC
jgi:hypothetical protein